MYTRAFIGTHTQAQIYDLHTGRIVRIRHRGLIVMGGRRILVRNKDLAHTHAHKLK